MSNRVLRSRFGLVSLALAGAMTLPAACECNGGPKSDNPTIGAKPPATSVPTTVRSGKYVITDLSLGMGGDEPKGVPGAAPAPTAPSAPAVLPPASGQQH